MRFCVGAISKYILIKDAQIDVGAMHNDRLLSSDRSTRIPRIGCVASKTEVKQGICRIYIPGEGLFSETYK